jgi:rubrerythrin
MNIEEAIRTALEYEVKIRDLYLEGVDATPEEAGKKIFKSLADDEQRHVDYLNHKLDEWHRTGKIVPEKLQSVLPPRESIQKELQKLRSRMKTDDRGLKQQMLSKALQLEIETSNFYKKMVEELPEEGRRMFARFLEIENAHIDAVQFELDYVSHTGSWFGFEEFDIEEGYTGG